MVLLPNMTGDKAASFLKEFQERLESLTYFGIDRLTGLKRRDLWSVAGFPWGQQGMECGYGVLARKAAPQCLHLMAEEVWSSSVPGCSDRDHMKPIAMLTADTAP